MSVFKAFLFLFFMPFVLFAERPDWTECLPFTDDAFWGSGMGTSPEDAEIAAKRVLSMQLCSRVKSAIHIETSTDSNTSSESEELDAFFSGNSLRGAELADQYEEDGNYWVLLKYCEECGQSLMRSAVIRFSDTLEYNKSEVMEKLSAPEVINAYEEQRRDQEKQLAELKENLNESESETIISEIVMTQAISLRQRLEKLHISDLDTEDIIVRIEADGIRIMIINFLPDNAVPTDNQKKGLVSLSKNLLSELSDMKYEQIIITGYANPTGKENEEEELISLSRSRAETMATYLSSAGLKIDSVQWKGGDDAIGDQNTAAGRGLNRRVELIVRFEK